MTRKAQLHPPGVDPSRNARWLQVFARAQPHQKTEPHIRPPGWEARKEPLKAALIADLHVGSHTDDVLRFEQIVEEVNAWRPDVVLLLGDFMNSTILGGTRVYPEVIADILAPLRTRLGVFAVLGNHDWRYDGHAVQRALEASGIVVLENSSHRIADASGEFWIAGLADHKTRTPDVARTLGTVPQDAPVLIMAHDPATFADIPPGPNLTVSGHTHGGQIRLPVIGPLINSSRAPLKWTSGHIIEGEKHLYVCRGLGTSLIPLRLNCRPELCFMSIGS